MQQQDTDNTASITDYCQIPPVGRILGLDPGTKRCGLAVSDPSRTVCRPLLVITRTNWKKLLIEVKELISEYDAVALVIGLPLETDGSESEMSRISRDMARKFKLSLNIPVVLQDERVSSYEANSRLWAQGRSPAQSEQMVDAEAAAVILGDLIDRLAGHRSAT